MFDSDDTKFPLSRRKLLYGVGGIGAATIVSGTATASGDPGDPGDGGGGGGDGGGDPPSGGNGGGNVVATVTLITGETVRVTGEGDRRRYTLPEEDTGTYRIYDVEDGTYVLPRGVDLDRLSPELFNVEFLIEQGVTDEETDEIPVIVELAGDIEARAGASAMSTGGFSPSRVLSSIDAVAGGVAKEQGAMATQNTLGSPVVEQVHLDVKYEALLDTSADAVNAPAAREEFGVDGSGVSIAILDSGIDADHPDFGDRVVHQEDFSGDGVADAHGHGTHCAGIAAGAGAENGEYVGMAPGADLWNVKVLGDGGSGATSEIAAGIEHAVDRGADVISMSLGGPAQENGPLMQAVNAAAEAGVVPAIAAGNNYSYKSIASPGNAERAITVGASDESGGIADFSSGGPTPYDYRVKPEVVAPGVAISATGSEAAGEYPYTDKSGTSMSTPHVAGISALLLEHDADRSPANVKDTLISTATPLDGPDAYKQGSGVVDTTAALGADLRVHGAVTNLGLFDSATTETARVELQNTGSEAIEVDVAASMENVSSGDSLPDNVSVSPSSVTVAAGATESVEFTVDTTDATGYNSGTLTFETSDGATHRAIFGFVRGIEVTVEKIPHEDSAGVEGDGLLGFAHDGSNSINSFFAFDANGKYSFVLYGGGEYTFWSRGELAAKEDQVVGEPTWTVETVEIGVDNSHVTLDESATVPRVLDTSQVAEHEPFRMWGFDASLYINTGGVAAHTNRILLGDLGVRIAHVTPVDESEPTNVGTTYHMFPENWDADYVLDADHVYQLFYGSLSVDGPTDVVEVDPAELAEERFEYHRTYEGQLFGVSPHIFPSDVQNFPAFVSTAYVTGIGDERVEQTWYRNEQARYAETWYDDGSIFGNYMLRRASSLIPEAGATYDQQFNGEPLTDTFTTWDLADGTLDLRGQWYADQSEDPFVTFQYAGGNNNEWAVSVDDEVVASDSSFYWHFPDTEISGLSPGSTVELSLDGNVMSVTERNTTTSTDYRVTYQPGTANTPPDVDAIDVTGLTTLNEVPAGQIVTYVDVAHEAAGVDEFEAFYAPTGSTSGTPFENPGGWQEAEVLYSDGDTRALLLETTGYTGKLDLAVAATDSAGNTVETASFEALTVADGAGAAVSVDVKPNDLDVDSGQNVPVVLSADGGVNVRDIDADSLRFGDPEAVADGGGAAPRRSHPVGRDRLVVHFRAADAGYPCTDGPVAAQLAGKLADGTPISGVDVVSKLTCRGQD